MMPYIDGFGVLHILKKDPDTRDTPFIFLTSKNEVSNFRQALNLSANDYIIRPFEGSDLLAAVEPRLKNIPYNISNTSYNSEPTPKTLPSPVDASSKDPLGELMEGRDILEYSKKQVIYKEGSTPRLLYYIKGEKCELLRVMKTKKIW